MSSSYLERIALALIKDAGLPEPIREYRFHPDRRWRADFVWLISKQKFVFNGDQATLQHEKQIKVMLEVDGGTWMIKGGHTTGQGFQNNCDKLNEAALMGFTVLRVTRTHIQSGQMIEWLKRALAHSD